MLNSKEITTSFLIADLAGYTSLTETHGDLLAANLVYRYKEIVGEILREDTVIVDSVGDAVLITSTNPGNLLELAIDLLQKTEDEPNFPSLHIGLNFGKIIEREGHYFGNTLNLTSRISSHSRGGQILCSEGFLNAVENKVNYKNVSKPIAILEINLNFDRKRLSIDPVCKMQVDIENPAVKIPFKDNIYYFCSHECTKSFIEAPEEFLGID